MKNVILIGDSVIFLEMIQEYIERRYNKVNCVKFYNPFSALQYIEAGNSIDTMIIDYQMPKLNGLEMAYRILVNHHQIRIIIYTNLDKAFLLNKWKQYGLNEKIEICAKSSLEDIIGLI